MNVIVSNKYTEVLKTLDIEIIKSLEGEYEIDEIIDTFDNFFFAKMILDITAIKNYKNVSNLQKLSISMDMDKVILLLDDSPETSTPTFVSQLVSMGIYNFTRNTEGIMYLLNNPNNYRDVAHLQQLNNNPSNYTTVSNQAINVQPLPNVSSVAMQQVTRRVIGIKNVTEQSGATTLVYMMKKQLQVSTTSDLLGNEMAKYHSAEVIIIDINKSQVAESMCTDVVYLIEPSTIKLNKLMISNRRELEKLKGKKVVLMQSILSTNDVAEFEYEAKLNVFFNMPPLDERKDNLEKLDEFLSKLGFSRQQVGKSNKKSGFLGLFD